MPSKRCGQRRASKPTLGANVSRLEGHLRHPHGQGGRHGARDLRYHRPQPEGCAGHSPEALPGARTQPLRATPSGRWRKRTSVDQLCKPSSKPEIICKASNQPSRLTLAVAAVTVSKGLPVKLRSGVASCHDDCFCLHQLDPRDGGKRPKGRSVVPMPAGIVPAPPIGATGIERAPS
jgi:hypothetical protein